VRENREGALLGENPLEFNGFGVIRVGRALHRLADEVTAVLGGLIGYVAVLAALGVGVIYLLEMEEVSAAIETSLRTEHAAVARPYVINDDRTERPTRPELRQSMAAR
jgi:hypothetical protein